MKIEIKLFASLSVGRFKSEIREFPSGARVEEVVESLGLAEGDVGIVLINGKHSNHKDALSDGDVLSLLPLMEGG